MHHLCSDERKTSFISHEIGRMCTKELAETINEIDIAIYARTTVCRIAELGFKCCRLTKKLKLSDIEMFGLGQTILTHDC